MFPMEIIGSGGRTLREAWSEGPHAHLGITVPGFPSLFLVYGPNTNTSGGSIIFYEETQVAYIRQAIEHVERSGAAAIEVRPEVESASDRAVQQRFDELGLTRQKGEETINSLIDGLKDTARASADAALEAVRNQG